MQQPLRITVKDIANSEAIEKHIREKVAKLEQFCDHIVACQVVVELIQKHQQQGKLHNVHIKLNVPGKELVVNNNARENLWIAIRDAFNGMISQLKQYLAQLRGQVKAHPMVHSGEIVRLIDDFGFIMGEDGDEFYFNANNVVSPNFNRLMIGTPVHFIEAVGSDGLQARRVSGKVRNVA